MSMEDEDGIDGPWERAMARTMKDDARKLLENAEREVVCSSCGGSGVCGGSGIVPDTNCGRCGGSGVLCGMCGGTGQVDGDCCHCGEYIEGHFGDPPHYAVPMAEPCPVCGPENERVES